MSQDPTSVTLDILTSQYDLVLKLIGDDTPSEESETDGPITSLVFNEVSDGSLDFLTQLANSGIPYDSSWGTGSEYTSGTEYCRYTEEGEIVFRTIYDDRINPELDALMEKIDSPTLLRNYILAHKESITIPGLDTQEENIKVFLTKKLINP